MTTTKKLGALLVLATLVLAAAWVRAQPFDSKFAIELDKEKAAMDYVRTKTSPEDPELKELAAALDSQTASGGYTLMSAFDLKKSLDAKATVLLVDTMPADSFAKEHLPGAVNFAFPIPLMSDWNAADTEGKSLDDFKALLGADRNRKIVFYCGFVKCTRSHNAAMWAKKLGYADVVRVPGGLFAWKGAGYPLEAGK